MEPYHDQPQRGTDDGAATAAPPLPQSSTNLNLIQMCFDEYEFEDATETFDPEMFLLHKQQHVPLETIERDLTTYAEHLRQSLLCSVHTDVHEAFVSVSGQLAIQEDAIRRAHQPVLQLQGVVDSAVESVGRSKERVMRHINAAVAAERQRIALSVLLQWRTLAARGAVLLHGLQAAAAVATTADSTDDINSTSAAVSCTAALVEPTRWRELVTIMIRQRHLVATIRAVPQANLDGLPSLTHGTAGVSPRDMAKRALEQFETDHKETVSLMSKRFLEAVQNVAHAPTSDAVANVKFVATLFHRLELEGSFIELFRDHLVRVNAEDVVTWAAAAKARGNPEEAERIVTQLCERLSGHVLAILPMLRTVFTPAASAQLIVQAVWPPVGDTLLKRLLSLFAPGLPNVYHRNFVCLNRVLRLVEEACASPEEVAALRAAPEAIYWTRKWNVDVYHTLRSTEGLDRVRAAVAKDQLLAPCTAAGPCCSLQSFQTVLDVLLWWFNPEKVFIFPLLPKFLRDAHTAVTLLVQTACDAVAAAQGTDAPLRTSEILQLCISCRQAPAFLEGKVLPCIRRAISQPSSAADSGVAGQDEIAAATVAAMGGVDAPGNLVEILVHIYTTGGDIMIAGLVSHVSAQCMMSLDHVRSIKSAYSMTGKPTPTSPSVFVHGSLDPIKQFQDAAFASNLLARTEVQEHVTAMLAEVCVRFGRLAKDILDGARKAQETLEKLKRRREVPTTTTAAATAVPTVNGGAYTISDRDKMVVQLYLDIHELGSMMRPFGINKESFAPVQQLLGLVKRANWILSGFPGLEPAEDLETN